MTCYIKNTRLPSTPVVTIQKPDTKMYCIVEDTNYELLKAYLDSKDFYELSYLSKSPMLIEGGPTTYSGCYYNGMQVLPFHYSINEGTVTHVPYYDD